MNSKRYAFMLGLVKVNQFLFTFLSQAGCSLRAAASLILGIAGVDAALLQVLSLAFLCIFDIAFKSFLLQKRSFVVPAISL